MNLVRWSCGCIGFRLTTDAGDIENWVLDQCDGEGEDYGCWQRDGLKDKEFQPYNDPTHVEHLLCSLNGLIKDGYRFRRVRTLLS